VPTACLKTKADYLLSQSPRRHNWRRIAFWLGLFISWISIHSLADPETAKRVVTYASAVGALTTIKPGAIAAQPTAAEVEAFYTKG